MSIKDWDGKMYALTICPYASPELHSALSNLPPRARAERIKQLAMVGLAVMSGRVGSIQVTAQTTPEQVQPVVTTTQDSETVDSFETVRGERRAALMGQLKGNK